MTKENAKTRAAAALTACLSLSLPLAAQQPVEPPPEKVELPEVEQGLEGEIRVAGSDLFLTLYKRIAKDFGERAADVDIKISGGGSGLGFRMLIDREAHVIFSSRPVRQPERAEFEKDGRAFVEVPIALHALAVVVPKSNDWVDFVTSDELRRLWAPSDEVRTWRDVRKTWPDVALERFAPERKGGYSSLLRPILGAEGCRLTHARLKSWPTLFESIAETPGGVGITDPIAAQATTDGVRLVRIDDGRGACEPTNLEIGHGRYSSLSRPILLYVDKASLERPEVRAFVAFFLADCRRVADDFRLVAVAGPLRRAAERILERRESGTRFLDEEGKPKAGTLAELYR